MSTRQTSRLLITLFVLVSTMPSLAMKNKVAQSGMTYLGISMGARETAMGDAATATVQGIQGLWHNPSVLANIPQMAATFNQVNWLIDTKLYGAGIAYSLGNWGTIGLDIAYMDFGEIMGTQRVDKEVDYRGFILTGDIGVEDYAIGLAYARRISDKFVLGLKVKRLHESLGRASYVVDEYEDPVTGEKIRERKEKEWALDDWGLDFGTVYNIGWKGLTFAMTMQNFSRDMKYWYEEFQTPMLLRMGMALDIVEIWDEGNKDLDLLVAIDALHPNDHTERIHVGAELLLMQKIALRGGYKFNHQVESFTFGLGLNISLGGFNGFIDYAYGMADYFSDVSRFTLSLQY
mgnify:CR=1 FL=1